MALERLGLGAIVKFDGSQAIAGMRRVGRSARQLSGTVGQVGASIGRGFSSAGMGLARTGAALLPFTVAAGFATKKAADFEQQMSNVASVARATDAEFMQLSNAAKHFGATTAFTATEAGQGLEALARAGFGTKDAIDALGGTLNLAAADSIELGAASTITASNVRAFGLEASQAARVADVLVRTSQRTNTNVTEMGEALKFAAPIAKTLGVDLATTSAVVGSLADVGIRGTLAGTALKNSLLKLSAPSKKAQGFLKDMGVEVVRTADGSLNLVETFSQLAQGLEAIPDKVKRLEILKEVTGLRGAPAIVAFMEAMKGAGDEGSKFGKLLAELQDQFTNGGAASEAAAKRLDNFKGAITILNSALEGLALETFGTFLAGSKGGVQAITKEIQGVVSALQLLNQGVSTNDARFSEFSQTTIAVAQGIKDAFDTVRAAIQFVGEKVQAVFSMFGASGPETVRTIAKMATLFFIVAAAIAPVLIALGGVAAFIGAVLVPVFTIGLQGILIILGVVVGAIEIVAVAVGGVLAAIALLRTENETFGETAMRVWNTVVAGVKGAIGIVQAFIQSIKAQLGPAVEQFKVLWNKFTLDARKDFQKFIGTVVAAVERLKPLFAVAFAFLSKVVGTFAKTAIGVLGGVITVLGKIASVAATVAKALVEGVVNALQKIAKVIVRVGGALPGVEIPPELAFFASQPKFEISTLTALGEAAKLGKAGAEVAPPTAGEILQNAEADVPGNIRARANLIGSIQQGHIAREKARIAGGGTEVKVDLTDQRKLDINNCMNVDGRAMAAATARNQIDVNERRGFKTTQWDKRVILEQGSVAVGGN